MYEGATLAEHVFDAREYLGDASPLRERMPGFRPRPQQLALADAVAACYSGDGHLLAEAGTGIGKSLAYLVPAAFAGRRVVVSTYTRSLQAQLAEQDLPLARLATGMPLQAAVVKGRANYLCRLQAAGADGRIELWDADGYERLRPWMTTTRSGDRDELDHVPSHSLWHELAVGPDRCRGRACAFVDNCFAERARAAAASAGVVLVNHALYMADLGLRSASAGALSVLPDHDLVVFDEAHTLADVARSWLGVRLSLASINRFVRDAERSADASGVEAPLRDLRQLVSQSERLFLALPGGSRVRLREAQLERLPLDAAAGMRSALHRVAAQLRLVGEQGDLVARAAEGLAAALEAVLEPDHDQTVVWSERKGFGAEAELRTAPIDVAPLLRDLLFDTVEGAVLVSATLALAEGFGAVRRELGIASARELRLDSPFDYASNARLYIPRQGPLRYGPHDETAAWAASQIERLLSASQGRALCLFASYRALNEVCALLAGRVPYTVLRQGDAPRERLLEEFRRDVSSVLFATTSFWQGVDVPGEALSLVVIDRVPFAPPDDPLLSARCEAAERDGASGFATIQLPRAAMLLKQGAGRLLRSEDDRGVIAILDRRVTQRGYGAYLLASLPDLTPVQSTEAVASFLAGHAGAEVADIDNLPA